MIQITVDTDADELRESLVIADAWFDDWRKVFERISIAWADSRREMYETAGASIGASWPMYSKATNEDQYAAVKSKILGHRMTRRDLLRWIGGTERLYPGMTNPSDSNYIHREGASRLTLGTSIAYAGKQDAGTGTMPEWAGGHPIPQRRMFKFGDTFERSIAEAVSEWATEGMAEGFSSSEVQQLAEATA